MKTNLLLLFFSLTFISIQAQKVKVLDREDNLPIENVTIYSDDLKTVAYTNKNGVALLNEFKDTDVLSFNHLGYIEFEILKRELGIIEYVVYLTKKSQRLDEIVLSASKTKETRNRIAEQVEIISKQEIRELAPQTSADLLANLPGVKVQKTQFGGGSPVLRGMEANRVLLVVDGVRMNNAIYRTGHLQNSISVAPSIIDRTEVVFGPSSVIYGSDALGGVIHFYTKTPKISPIKEVNTGFYSRYSSANNEFTNEFNIEYRGKKFATFTSVSHSKFGDLRMGNNRKHGFDDWGKVFEFSDNTNSFYNPNPVVNNNPTIQKNTGYSQTDVLQKVTIPLAAKTDLILNAQYSESSDNDRFDNLTTYDDGELKFAEWYYGPQKRLLLSSQLKFNPNKNWLNKGTITAAYQNLKESRVQRKFTSLERLYRFEDVDVYSLNGDFFVSLTEKDDRIMSYGFEITHNEVGSNSYGKILEVAGNSVIGFSGDFTVQSRYPDGGSSYSSYASYVNYRQNINKKSTLNTGIRFVHTDLSAKWIDDTFITLPDFDINLNNSAITATIGYVYKPNTDWQVNTVLASGFRSPNIDDVGKIREKSGNVTVPNIYLKPEYAYSAETSILKYFNNKQFQAGINVYYTLLDNYITRDYFEINNSPTIIYDGEEGNIVANVNKDKAYIVGTTMSFKGIINENFSTQGSFTYTKGESYDTNMPLSSIPPLFSFLEVTYQKNKLAASINWRFNAKKPISDYNLIEGIDNENQTPFIEENNQFYGSPSWSTLNISTNYKFNNSATLFINLDNIFDIHYKEFASAISAPGRNLSVSLQVTL